MDCSFDIGVVSLVGQDAEEEDRGPEEGRDHAGEAEGDFESEVCGGLRQASMQPADDMRLMHQVTEESSLLLLLRQLCQNPNVCTVWQNQVHVFELRLCCATPWSQC